MLTLQFSSLGAASLAGPLVLSSPGHTENVRTRKQPTQIRIGVRFSAAWLRREKDNDLRFLKQIGVDYANITLDQNRDTGCFTPAPLRRGLCLVWDTPLDRGRKALHMNSRFFSIFLTKSR